MSVRRSVAKKTKSERPPAPSPVGVVELLHQPPAVGQSDLDVGDGLGGVEADRGAGLGLVGGLVLLGGGRWRGQLGGGAAEREDGRKREREKKRH